MKQTEIQQFKITQKQKQTLSVLRTKYSINTSQFIREAINEKLMREKEAIFKHYKEVREYINQMDDCPF